MELKNGFVIYIGIGVFVLLILFLFIYNNKKSKYRGGKKVVRDELSNDNPVFRRRMRLYRILSFVIMIACMAGIAVSFVILARPVETATKEKTDNNRDIILSIDVSTSVDNLNMNLVEKLKKTVMELKGERFGIQIFNTSTVLLTPLTDDYEFVIGYRLYEFILTQYKKDLIIVNGLNHPIPSIFGIPIRIDHVNPDVCYLIEDRIIYALKDFLGGIKTNEEL